MTSILERAIARHGLCAAAVEHRTGTVALSEPSVLIAVSAPHRAEAFAGGREIIDELKRAGADLEAGGGRVGTGTPAEPTRPTPDRADR